MKYPDQRTIAELKQIEIYNTLNKDISVCLKQNIFKIINKVICFYSVCCMYFKKLNCDVKNEFNNSLSLAIFA